MKKSLVTIITLSALVLLMGCCPCRKLTYSGSGTRLDSTIIEYRERIVIVPDTVYLDIPRQTAERTITDSVSHLENDYALSDARINADGTLFHDLKTKPQKKPVEFQKPVERRDSIVYRERVRTETVTKTVEVPRQLTWFQKTSIYGFWAAIIFLMIVYTIKRIKAHILKIR